MIAVKAYANYIGPRGVQKTIPQYTLRSAVMFMFPEILRHSPSFFLVNDIRLIPLLVVSSVTSVQILVAVLRRIRSCTKTQHTSGYDRAVSEVETLAHAPTSFFTPYIDRLGGYSIFYLAIVRVFSASALLVLSIITARKCGEDPSHDDNASLVLSCPEYGLTISFLYATFMALILILSKQNLFAGELNILALLSVLGVYACRDIYPLATYTQHPADAHEGNILWLKIGILIMACIVVPISTPRHYVPVDKRNPMPVPNPEQTAPWISRLTFSHINPLIALAQKVSHLGYEQLPPLPDGDSSKYQCSQAFIHLEASRKSRHHIFFALLRHLTRGYVIYFSTMFVGALLSFTAPYAIKKILQYLETRGEEAYVRPWVWICLLLVGPLSTTIVEEWCMFAETKIRVHLQAILTQFVFEHSLRIRLKADLPSTEASEVNFSSTPRSTHPQNTPLTTEENESTASEEESLQETALGTASSSTAERNSQSETQNNVPAQKTQVVTTTNKSENLIGKINNLVTSDMENIVEGVDFINLGICVPLRIALCLAFLYDILGWSAFVGFASIIALTPLGGYVGKKMQDVQSTLMKMTDARVQRISESVNVLRMVKMFGWEAKMTRQLEQSRETELGWLWRMKVLRVITNMISFAAPTLSMLLTYATYTTIMKEQLNASIIFSSMAVFTLLIAQLHRISWQTSVMIAAKVSLDRLNDFIQNAELLDHFMGPERQSVVASSVEPDLSVERFGFKQATFAWAVEVDNGCLTPTRRRFRLHIEDELSFKRNCINLIIGPTGCGKTSMLMALLGEMHFMPSGVDSWYNLPRHGGVSYAAQESWVQNATIRENILFGSPFDQDRYQKVLHQCALEADLKLFEAGDKTEVGERGLTLSGGQKARVTLARAIYSPAQIVLLDDVLAALDVHTASWIVNKCFCGDLIKNRTLLLVTHNVALVGSIAQLVVSIGLDGGVRSQGTDINVALAVDPILASEVERDGEMAAKEDVHSDAIVNTIPAGKLVLAEEIAHGHISWQSMKLLFDGLGGDYPVIFFTIIIATAMVEEFFNTGRAWFLGVWGAQYETHHPSEVSLKLYLSVYSAILLGRFALFAFNHIYYQYHAISAARSIHAKLIGSVFGSTLRWLDETPTARIISRCTGDIRTVDQSIAQSLFWVMLQIIGASVRLFAITAVTPIFVLPGAATAFSGVFLGNMYLKAQLSVKRETSNARSPMLAHFSAAMHGLISLRAYNAQNSFRDESYKHIDHYSRTSRTSWDLNRWIGLRIDVLGAIFTSVLAAYLVYGKNASASNTGFSMNLAFNLSSSIFWLIRIFNELEVQANSLERIQDYLVIEHEPPYTETGKSPAAWPTSGALRVENLNARYSPSGPNVLQNISFDITSGERVGVVGRTGSGKSSLTLALLRCILTEGAVFYDGIQTSSINLDDLRSNITIIPQSPELLSGTIRENLDPFGENEDLTLNQALESSGLTSVQQDSDTAITLDTLVSGGGSNISVGQRQIIALARAIVRKSKLLILDEATSAVDYKTDAVIQRTLRTEIGSDVTVITIAHRLQTIMDSDRIMVLDSGNLVEFDTPNNLLRKEKGVFRSLVEGGGDQENLTTLVHQ